MPGWENHHLCMCGQVAPDRPAGAAAFACLYRANRGCRRHGVVSGDVAAQPLRQLCAEVFERKQAGTAAQVLVLHDASARGWLPDAGQDGWPFHLVLVEICGLEKAGHPDVLQALASGFDLVLIQESADAAVLAGQQQECALASGLGGGNRVRLFAGPEALAAALAAGAQPSPPAVSEPVPPAGRRETARLCAAALLPGGEPPVPLPADAPYGTIRLDPNACTLCQSCVWLCPADALFISEDGCELSFAENACIQCGLCAAVCPHRALRLEPRMDVSPAAAGPQVLHEAVPHLCIRCEQPYVPLSTLERLVTRFREGMLDGEIDDLPRLFAMCGSCRAAALQEAGKKTGLAVSRLDG